MDEDDRGGSDDTLPASTGRVVARPPDTGEARYELREERGRGGLGRVLEAFDRTLGRLVAVKELLRRGPTTDARFAREALITASLQHPSIVPVYDAGLWSDGAPFYAMKLVSGRTLAELVAEKRTLEERLTLLPNVLAVVDAIAYAHSQGVMHRDLKGSNVLVGEFGETLVVDWGLAKRLDEADVAESSPPPSPYSPSGLTAEGAILGTPLFMAPEQARGETVDARADVWALGAMLYYVLTTKAPFEGIPALALLEAVKAGHAPSVRTQEGSVARELASIVDKALAGDPAARYPTARELAADLRAFLNGRRVVAHAYSPLDHLARVARRNVGVAVALALFLLVGSAAAAVMAVREQRLRRAAETERDRADGEKARADRQSRALLEQQGRDELDGGRPSRAAVYLAEAYRRDPSSLVLRSLLTEALRALAGRNVALAGHEQDVPCAAYSPDGTRIVTGSTDRTARVFDATTGATLHVLPDHGSKLEWVGFSADGARVVTGSGGKQPKARIWETATGRLLATWSVPDLYRVAFTPDGASLVVGGHEGGLLLVDARTGATRVLDAVRHSKRIAAFAFRPGTREMAVACWDKVVSIWDYETGALRATLSDHDQDLVSVDYSKDGRYMLVAEREGAMHVRDAATFVRLRTLRLPEGAISPTAVFGPDARTIVTGTHDGRVRTWHTSSGALLRLLDVQPAGKLFQIAVRPDGREVVTTGNAGSAHTWALDAAVDFRLIGDEPLLDAAVQPSFWTDEGRTLVMPRADGVVELRDAATLARRTSIRVGGDAHTVVTAAAGLGVTGERATSFPPRLWARDGRPGPPLAGHSGPIVYGLAATPDGTTLLTGDYDGTLRAFDARSGALRASYPLTRERISSIAVTPDGASWVVGTEPGALLFVDPASGRITRTLAAHPTWIQWLAYAQGGARLVTVGRQDHAVKLWAAGPGAPAEGAEPLAVFLGHTGNLVRASLSPDGLRLASASNDGTVRVWDARTAELLRIVRGPSMTAQFSPSGDELLTTGDRGYAVLWQMALDPRGPDAIAAFVAARSPWVLVDGRLRAR